MRPPDQVDRLLAQLAAWFTFATPKADPLRLHESNAWHCGCRACRAWREAVR